MTTRATAPERTMWGHRPGRGDAPDIRQRLLGGLIVNGPDGHHAGVDNSALIQRLLLFETFILQSGRFWEFPYLIRTFGHEGVRALLRSGALSLELRESLIGLAGGGSAETQVQVRGSVVRVSPLRYTAGELTFDDEGLEKDFEELSRSAELAGKKAKKLEQSIRARLLPRVEHGKVLALEQTLGEFDSLAPHVRRAIEVAGQRGLPPADLRNLDLRIRRLVTGSHEVEADISRCPNATPEQVASAIKQGFGGVANMNARIDDMRSYSALVGFRDEELPVFGEKLDFVAHQLDPEAQVSRLSRVLELAELPDISDPDVARGVSLERVVEVRESQECRGFREWLWGSGAKSNEEIEEHFRGIRNRLATFIRAPAGKRVRWLATEGLGFVPVLGNVVSFLDEFVVEKVLKDPGPLSFISRQYPSIFDRR